MSKMRLHMEYSHLTKNPDGSYTLSNPNFSDVYDELLNTSLDSCTIDEFQGKFQSFALDRSRGPYFLERMTYLQTFNSYTSKLVLQGHYCAKGLYA